MYLLGWKVMPSHVYRTGVCGRGGACIGREREKEGERGRIY